MYGVEVVILTNFQVPMLRTEVEEGKEHQRLRKYHSSKVKHKVFKLDDLVLKQTASNIKELNAGKLGTNWKAHTE